MSFSYQEEVSNGVQTVYAVDFDFRNTNTIYVYAGEHNTYATQLSWQWVTGNTQIELTNLSEVPAGTKFYIRRIIDREQLAHTFENKSMRGKLVDEQNYAALYLMQEIMDGFIDRDNASPIPLGLDMLGQAITNLKDGTNDTDAVTLGQAKNMVGNLYGRALVQLSTDPVPHPNTVNEGQRMIFIDTLDEFTLVGGMWVEDGNVGDEVDVTAASHLTLAQAQASDLQIGQYVRLTNRANGLYQVVDAGDTGGYYQDGLVSGRKLAIKWHQKKDAEKAGLAYGGDKPTRTNELNNILGVCSEGDELSVSYRVSLTTTTSSTNTIDFNSVSWPDNVTVKYQGPTREQVTYLNHISHGYGAYPEGVPVNEKVIVAPYHVARVMDLKTPDSFTSEQTAHRLANDYSLVGVNYMSHVWRVDGATVFQDLWDMTQGAEVRRYNLFPKSGTYSGQNLVNRVTFNGQNGDTGIQMPMPSYPHDVAGARRVVRKADNQFDNNNRFDRVQDIIQDEVVGRGYRTFIDPSNGVLTFAEFPVASAQGTIVRREAPSQAFWYVASGFGPNAAGAAFRIGFNNTTGRSINAGGTINASGADYAEYMFKSGDFTLAKGDICGINSEGMLTNKFSESIKFVVKSTNPAYVGGDDWHKLAGEEPAEDDTAAHQTYLSKLEELRKTVDRVAFCGRVPVNFNGELVSGAYLIPVQGANDSIEMIATVSPSFDQYILSVGQCIDAANKLIVVRN